MGGLSSFTNPTARRIARVCGHGKRGQQEIADALGTAPGSIAHTLGKMLDAGDLHTDAPPPEPGTKRKLERGALYWVDDHQLTAAEEAARAARDPGLICAQQMMLLVHGARGDPSHETLHPDLIAGCAAWAVRLAGGSARWLVGLDPDAGHLVADQITEAVGRAGGHVEQLSPTTVLDGSGLRRYLTALRAEVSGTKR